MSTMSTTGTTSPRRKRYRKGERIYTLEKAVDYAVPLFPVDDDDDNDSNKAPADGTASQNEVAADDIALTALLRLRRWVANKLHLEDMYLGYAMVLSLHLILIESVFLQDNDNDSDLPSVSWQQQLRAVTMNSNEVNVNRATDFWSQQSALLQRKLVQTHRQELEDKGKGTRTDNNLSSSSSSERPTIAKMDLNAWKILVQYSYQHAMLIVYHDHPIHACLKQLRQQDDEIEWKRVVQNLLRLPNNTAKISNPSSSALVLQQRLNEKYPRVPYAVLLLPRQHSSSSDDSQQQQKTKPAAVATTGTTGSCDDNTGGSRCYGLPPPHSCMPTSVFEIAATDTTVTTTTTATTSLKLAPVKIVLTALVDIPAAYYQYDEDDEDGELDSDITRLTQRNSLSVSYLPQSILQNGSWEERALWQERRSINILQLTNAHDIADFPRNSTTCFCLRCRYEAAANDQSENGNNTENDASISMWNAQELLQLGHFYLANNQLNRAERLLQKIIAIFTRQEHSHQRRRVESLQGHSKGTCNYAKAADNKSSTIYCTAEAWHALGAIALTQGKFLEAQTIWQKAVQALPELIPPATTTIIATETSKIENTPRNPVDNKRKSHPGLALQAAKLDAYGYLNKNTRDDTKAPKKSLVVSNNPSKEVVAGKAFITQLLDESTCKQVLQWLDSLEDKHWTSGRHYAVPTRDIPVHSVPHLLEWFVEWMDDCMKPCLARQFGTSVNYYVHDAFFVCYESGKSSDRLPIHVDESTHSFVLALNQNFTGGGTYLSATDTTLKLSAGEVFSFLGSQLEHGGEAVTNGTRYILAVFLYLDDDAESSHHTQGAHVTEHLSKGSLCFKKKRSASVLEKARSEVEFSFQFDDIN